jgi:DHA1 family tetracycline resistance protein-like MFS transporter
VKTRSAPLAILFVVVFIDLLGFGMVIPVMPLYAQELGAKKEWIGLTMAGYSAMQFVFAPIWGRLSDRIGRRPVLLVSIAMTSVGFLGYAFAPTFGWLLASRLFAGAATANIAIARAYIADVTPPEGRAKGMGVIGAAFGLGFVLGPFLGGVLSEISLGAPGYAAAALAAVNGVAAWFVLPEPKERVVRPAAARGRVSALAEELSKPGIRRLVVIYLLHVLAFSAMEATFALLARERYALDRGDVNFVFAYLGVILVVVQGGLIGPLTRRFGEVRLLVTGLVLMAISLAVLPFGRSLPVLLAALVPLAGGSGLAQPALTALMSKLSRDDDQGGTMGMGESASALGRIIGPEAGTFTYGRIGVAFPYVAAAAIMAVTAIVAATVGSARAARPRAGSAAEGGRGAA